VVYTLHAQVIRVIMKADKHLGSGLTIIMNTKAVEIQEKK